MRWGLGSDRAGCDTRSSWKASILTVACGCCIWQRQHSTLPPHLQTAHPALPHGRQGLRAPASERGLPLHQHPDPDERDHHCEPPVQGRDRQGMGEAHPGGRGTRSRPRRPPRRASRGSRCFRPAARTRPSRPRRNPSPRRARWADHRPPTCHGLVDGDVAIDQERHGQRTPRRSHSRERPKRHGSRRLGPMNRPKNPRSWTDGSRT